MQIHQIFTHSPLRNFTYILHSDDGRRVYCVDPFDAAQIVEWLERRRLRLTHIINTHEHEDHTRGNRGLVEQFGVPVLAHPGARSYIDGFDRGLRAGEHLEIENEAYCEVLDTPGHTFCHCCLLLFHGRRPQAVISGDTLFAAGVGHCRKGGEPGTLYETIATQFHTLPDHVQVYPGHDYVENNLGFTLEYEPGNHTARVLREEGRRLAARGEFVLTTIGLERQISTFFRLSSPELRRELARYFPDVRENTDERTVFLRLRQLRDRW